MPENYRPDTPPAKSLDKVKKRVDYLRSVNEPYLKDRTRIRALMNGGKGALDVLLEGLPTNEDTLPAANYIKSGIERFGEMIGHVPDLRIDAPDHNEKDRPKRAAEKRERIVTSYDEKCRLPHQVAQTSLWLPGYAFSSWKVHNSKDRNGYRYPKAQLRDPYSTYPAPWGVDQQPVDIAYRYLVSPDDLVTLYPRAKTALDPRNSRKLPGGGVDLSTTSPHQGTNPGWDGVTGGVEVYEYVDAHRTYVWSPACNELLDVIDHETSRAPFVVPRRITFDNLQGHFDDAIGLAKQAAKMTLLTQIIMEDAAFAPVIVNGRMDQPFRKGRDAVNVIEGGDAKYLYQNIPYQMFNEIDRVVDHLRQTTGYSKQVDGEAPMSFVTGQGLEELGSSVARQAERYQLVMREALEDLDSIRLEMDEKLNGDEERPLEGTRRGASFSETYVPSKDIAGNYRTRRVYGLMAGMDQARRTVGMLQLLSAGVIDKETVQENLRDIDNAPQVRDRIVASRAEDTLFEMLNAAASQGDPRAGAAMNEVMKDPKNLTSIIEEFFSPQEEEVPAEDPAAMAAAGGPPGGGTSIGQALARLQADGDVGGGTQVQYRMGGAA